VTPVIIWTITSGHCCAKAGWLWLIIMLCVSPYPKTTYIFEHEQTVLPIYDTANTTLVADLEGSTSLSVQELHSEQEFELALCSAIYPEIGLVIPADIRPTIGGESVEFQGYSCWGKRHQASEAQPKLEELLSQSLGMQVEVNIQGNIIYPPSEGVLYISLATVNSIVLILMIGMFIVPNLLIEEKETKTMEALLASPASIAQVVSRKALAGIVYILVSAIIIFLITWTDIIHWDMVLLFVIGSGIFSVAVGLVLGVCSKPQDMAGWMVAILLILVGAILLKHWV
jgi:hypothetical protein